MDRYKQFKDYKQIKIPPELHEKLKTAAAKQNKTMVQFLEELIKNK